eukprot:CAMPEP_0197545420 /NCGR_PEP_ID=MMETSP1320-20131121/474_1 /TAXON_ID=91990 /ORGANISM="Bolidomonas sp., Strain RCC2347" /LENGTH=67 /DNA_ID=CAMNT_0043104931 /DNA_START=26 /DNA_END=226 /DNA_ORIENTATION=-
MFIDYRKENIRIVHMMCQKAEHNNLTSEEPLTIKVAKDCIDYIDRRLNDTYFAYSGVGYSGEEYEGR